MGEPLKRYNIRKYDVNCVPHNRVMFLVFEAKFHSPELRGLPLNEGVKYRHSLSKVIV